LTPDQRRREAIRLHETGLNHAAIAEHLGVSRDTVKKYLKGRGPANNPSSRAGYAASRHNPAEPLDRINRAFDLRLQGLLPRQIGELLGVSAGRVNEYLRRYVDLVIQPKADELRQIELERYDLYLEKLQPKIERGDDKAINAAVRVSEARRRLLGLDAPVKIDAQVLEVTQQDLELQEMLREAQARNEATAQQLRDGWEQEAVTIDPHVGDEPAGSGDVAGDVFD